MDWIGWTVVTLVGWGVWPVLNKLALRTLTWPHLVVAAWLANTLVVAMIVGTRPNLRALASADGLLALAAGVISQVAVVAFYLALRSGAVAAVTPLSALYPALTALLAALLLREQPSALQWLGVGVAVLAVVLLARG
jgi:bacterial/archaeal transporter family protein